MNIKEKLIEQIGVLEKAQQVAFGQAEPSIVTNISTVILDYIRHLEDYEDEYDICEDCIERELHEQMVNDIAKASDLPIELVQRVLDGQAEVLGMED